MSSVVCLSSVTRVHPTQPVEILRNVSSPFGTLGIRCHSRKILRRSSQGNPPVGGLNAKRVVKYSDFAPIEGYISELMQDRRKLVLITNRKSHMSFRLVLKPVTLNGLDRRYVSEIGSSRGALHKGS